MKVIHSRLNEIFGYGDSPEKLYKQKVVEANMEHPSLSKRIKTIKRLYKLYGLYEKASMVRVIWSSLRKPKYSWRLLKQCIDLEKSFRYTNSMEKCLSVLYNPKDINNCSNIPQMEVPDDLYKSEPKDNYQIVMAKNKKYAEKYMKSCTKKL